MLIEFPRLTNAACTLQNCNVNIRNAFNSRCSRNETSEKFFDLFKSPKIIHQDGSLNGFLLSLILVIIKTDSDSSETFKKGKINDSFRNAMRLLTRVFIANTKTERTTFGLPTKQGNKTKLLYECCIRNINCRMAACISKVVWSFVEGPRVGKKWDSEG